MAERIVDILAKRIKQKENRSLKASYTDNIPLLGGPFQKPSDVQLYRNQVAEKLKPLGLPAYYADYLVANYGKQTEQILSHLPNVTGDALTRLTRSELYFTIHNELVLTPLDFFNRRTGRLYFNLPSISLVQEAIFQDFQRYFNWDTATLEKERLKLKQAIQEAAHFEYSKEYV